MQNGTDNVKCFIPSLVYHKLTHAHAKYYHLIDFMIALLQPFYGQYRLHMAFVYVDFILLLFMRLSSDNLGFNLLYLEKERKCKQLFIESFGLKIKWLQANRIFFKWITTAAIIINLTAYHCRYEQIENVAITRFIQNHGFVCIFKFQSVTVIVYHQDWLIRSPYCCLYIKRNECRFRI